MRIGIDIRLRNESGVGRYIHNLVNWLAKIDKKNKYVLFGSGTWNMERGRWNMLPVNLKWHSLKEQMLMPRLLIRQRLDLVHFPYFNVPLFYPGKFVVTIHDLIIDHFDTGRASTLNPLFYWVKRLGYKLVMRYALWRAEKIIVPSKATKEEVLKHYKVDPKKVLVIYEGTSKKIRNSNIEIRNKPQILNSKFKTLTAKQYFLYVGNAYPHKNLERLLRAFLSFKVQGSRFKAKRRKTKLVLVGREDFFYKRLKGLVRDLKLEKEVIFTGYLSDEELGWLYQKAIALVLPSLMEGFGLPALEAMQNACLVLASNIPALREVCQDGAIYFNPESEEGLSEELYKSYTTYKTNRTYIEKGFARAKNFSWEKMARETLKVYEGCFSL